MSQPRFLLLACALLVLWMGCISEAHAQTQSTPLPGLLAPGAPPMQVYATASLPGVPETRTVAVAEDGRVFIGNDAGVFTVRGPYVSDLIPLHNKSSARSLAIGPDERVYVGGSNELGYLAPTRVGELRYESLLAYLPERYRTFQEVQVVRTFGASVYFYAFRQLMRWTPATGTMKVWRFDHVSVLVKEASEPVLQDMAEGSLKRLVGDTWQTYLRAPDVLGKEPVRLIAPHPDGGSTVITGRAMYHLDGTNLRHHPSAIDSVGRRRWVYDVAVLPGGYYAVATRYNGVLFVDANGTHVRTFSTKQGLPDNSVPGLAYDGAGNLWICTEGGLARLDLGSGVSFVGRREGLENRPTALALYDGHVYVGGGEQLARLDAEPEAKLTTVATPPDDILGLLSTPQGLLVGMSRRLRLYRDGALQEIPGFPSDIFYPTTLLRSAVDTTRLYVGFWHGVATLRLERGRWVFADTISVPPRITSLAEAPDGTLWMGTEHEDLWRVRFGGGEPQVQHFGSDEGLPRLTVAPLWVEGEMLFYTSKGLYRHVAGRMVRDTTSALGAALGYAPLGIAHASRLPDGTVLLLTDDEVLLMRRTAKGYTADRLADRLIRHPSTTGAWFVRGRLWMARPNMLVQTPSPTTAPMSAASAYIEAVRSMPSDSLLYGSHGAPVAPALPPHGGIHFAVSTPRYGGAQFRYRLDEVDDDWAAWTHVPVVSYPTLPTGHYTFRVQAQDRYGVIGEEAVYAFSVMPPWYASRSMIALYGVLALLLVLACVAGATRWQEHRSEASRRLLAAKVRVHTREAEAQKRMLRYLNKTLQESNTRLEEMSAQKSHLLSIAAHDLKTPIANIYSLAEILLEEREEGPANYEFLDLIRTSARQMSQLIDDVLNSEARETGQLRLNPAPADLRTLASRAVQQCTVQAERKGQIIRLHVVPPELAFEAEVDESRIVDAMINFVNNAVKYSRLHAVIEVHLTRTDDAYRFEVRDEGPGVREEDREGLFQPFQRLSAQPTGGESSSGMGLYIVRQYVEMHEGRVGVESMEGVGSIFWFMLPAPPLLVTPAASRVGVESESPA